MKDTNTSIAKTFQTNIQWLAKPSILFFKGNSSRYGGITADKNDAVTDDAQKGYVSGSENIYDHHRGVINNDVKISGENMAEEFHNEENNVYVDDGKGGMQHILLYNHHDVKLSPQTYTAAPHLEVTNPSFLGFQSTFVQLNVYWVYHHYSLLLHHG